MVTFPPNVALPVALSVPVTSKLYEGLVLQIPTFPSPVVAPFINNIVLLLPVPES